MILLKCLWFQRTSRKHHLKKLGTWTLWAFCPVISSDPQHSHLHRSVALYSASFLELCCAARWYQTKKSVLLALHGLPIGWSYLADWYFCIMNHGKLLVKTRSSIKHQTAAVAICYLIQMKVLAFIGQSGLSAGSQTGCRPKKRMALLAWIWPCREKGANNFGWTAPQASSYWRSGVDISYPPSSILRFSSLP